MSFNYQQTPSGRVNFDWPKEAWELVNTNGSVWLGAMLITCLVGGAVSDGLDKLLNVRLSLNAALVAHGFSPQEHIIADPLAYETVKWSVPNYWFSQLLLSAVTAYFASGLMQMANEQVRGEPPDLTTLFKGYTTYPAVFVVNLAVVMIGYEGILLGLIPGLIIYALFLPSMAMAADGQPIGDCFTKSVRAMFPQTLNAMLFVLYGLMVALIAFFCTCGLGILAVFPLFAVCSSLAYRDMVGMPQVNDLGQAPHPSYNPYTQPSAGGWSPSAQNDPASSQNPAPSADAPRVATPYLPYGQGQSRNEPPPASPPNDKSTGIQDNLSEEEDTSGHQGP